MMRVGRYGYFVVLSQSLYIEYDFYLVAFNVYEFGGDRFLKGKSADRRGI